jgi:hypothetical protein
MRRNLLRGQRHRLDASGLRQREAATLMDRETAAQVGKLEGALAVAAIGGPMRLKRVSYSLIGNSCPWQNIQPAGAKLPANMRISPT